MSSAYRIVHPDAVPDHYAGTDVPGEFRRLTDELEAEQLALTLIRVPPTPTSSRARATAMPSSRSSTSSCAAR
ncbi:hypothetical protein FSW04_12925 [Baekduia soli]|uniref:Uncharacterized protein n=1 Tax=Baekduia soli TaxID=496014 RepID=A0A5B8U6U4_9ACTN|nr:hypothetical protein [Baekduia soli]QEC48382.1 hypothetical protein FSW04_12925 [Baekduia soli]